MKEKEEEVEEEEEDGSQRAAVGEPARSKAAGEMEVNIEGQLYLWNIKYIYIFVVELIIYSMVLSDNWFKGTQTTEKEMECGFVLYLHISSKKINDKFFLPIRTLHNCTIV